MKIEKGFPYIHRMIYTPTYLRSGAYKAVVIVIAKQI